MILLAMIYEFIIIFILSQIDWIITNDFIYVIPVLSYLPVLNRYRNEKSIRLSIISLNRDKSWPLSADKHFWSQLFAFL